MELCSRHSGRLWHLKTKLTKTAPFVGRQTSHYRSVYNSSHVTSLGISAPVCLFRVLHNNDSLNFNIMTLTVCSRGCKEHKMNLVSSGYEERCLEANLKMDFKTSAIASQKSDGFSTIEIIQRCNSCIMKAARGRIQELCWYSGWFRLKEDLAQKICVWSQSQVLKKLRSL